MENKGGERRDGGVSLEEMSERFREGANGLEANRAEGARGERVRRISGREFFEKTGIDGRKVKGAAEISTEEAINAEDLEARREKIDKYYESLEPIYDYVDRLEPVPFRAPDGNEAARARRNEERMARKLTVALITGDARKLGASDYELGDETDYLVHSLEELDEEQIDSIGDSILGQIATAVGEKGAEAVYDKLREDEEATIRLYNLTESWKDKDDKNREISLEEQREIGAEAINEVLDKYPTALSFYREVQAETKRRRETEAEGATEERLAFEESAMRLGKAIYGAQFRYAEVFEDYIADEVKFGRNIMSWQPEAVEEPTTLGGESNLETISSGIFNGRRVKYRDIRPEMAESTGADAAIERDLAEEEAEKVERPEMAEATTEDTRIVRESLEKLAREKAEAEEAEARRAEEETRKETEKAAEEEAKAKRKQEVLEAREEAKERFGVKFQQVKEPEETWRKVKVNKAVFVSGGELVDIYGGSDGQRAETKSRRYGAKDFEEIGLIPSEVASYISGRNPETGEEIRRTVIMSSPFKISGGDRGAGVLIWRQKEMTEKGKQKTGKQYKFFPEVYYKRDMDTDKRWLKVEGFAQAAQLGPGAIDYDFMEKQGEEFVKETSEGLSSVLDLYVEDQDDFDYVADRRSGDLILASATKQKAAVRADIRARSGASRVMLNEPRRS